MTFYDHRCMRWLVNTHFKNSFTPHSSKFDIQIEFEDVTTHDDLSIENANKTLIIAVGTCSLLLLSKCVIFPKTSVIFAKGQNKILICITIRENVNGNAIDFV